MQPRRQITARGRVHGRKVHAELPEAFEVGRIVDPFCDMVHGQVAHLAFDPPVAPVAEKLHVNSCEVRGPQARYGDETWEVPILAQVAGLTIDGVIARVVAAQASPDRPVGLDRAKTGALSACDQIRRSTGRWPCHDWTARNAPPTSRGAKNRFDRSVVWMDAMQDFTVSLPSRAWEGPLGDPTSTTTEERFLRLAGSELDRAYRLAGFLLADAQEAEDATQEALIRAWRSIGSLRDPDSFRPWFDRILVNLCRDRLRRRRRIRFIPLDGAAELVQARDPFGAILDRDEMLGLLNVLEPDERIVVVLHYWADLTLVEVARRLDWPIGTVKSRLHRALDTIAGSPGGRGGRL